MGCYLAPNYTLMIESVVTEIKERPWVDELLVEGDLDVKLE